MYWKRDGPWARRSRFELANEGTVHREDDAVIEGAPLAGPEGCAAW